MSNAITMKRKRARDIRAWATSDDSRPLLLKGARRTGKTYLIEHVGTELFGSSFVKLDFQTDLAVIDRIFDGPTDDIEQIASRIAEYKGVSLHPESSLLFFDEVQLHEKALNALRFFGDSPWKVIASGSLLGVSSGQRRLPFPSGIRQMELHPLDFEEYLWALGEDALAASIREHVASLDRLVLHEKALELCHRYLVLGGMPLPLRRYLETHSFDAAADELEEIDATYTADMTDPENGISGISAKRIWDSLPKQLLRASTKKFKYSDVVRGGRRERLLEPLEWLSAAGIISIHDLTRDTQAPLSPFNDEEGSYFKVYVGDTGLMFHKFGIAPSVFLGPAGTSLLSSDFRGALAENYVMQSLKAAGVKSFYWMPASTTQRGEVDFVYQTPQAEVIPVEVKSARNVSAKSLKRLMREGHSPYAIRLSENEFGRTVDDEGFELRSIPLYAAFCVGEQR